MFRGTERSGRLVPAAGEAAGPPMQSREIIASSSSLRGTYGGPAAPPAAGTNVAFSSGGAGAFVPAAGEAAGPPMQSRESSPLRRRFGEPMEGRRPRRPQVQMLRLAAEGRWHSYPRPARPPALQVPSQFSSNHPNTAKSLPKTTPAHMAPECYNRGGTPQRVFT